MHNGQKHIIQRVFLEVETGSLKTAHYLREHLDTFLKNEVFPMLETYFNTVQISKETVFIQTEKLHLDLDVEEQYLRGNFDELKRIFQKQIKKEIEKLSVTHQQVQYQNNKEAKPVSPERKLYNTFFHFVKTGETPWWASAEDVDMLSDPGNIPLLIFQKGFARDFMDVLRDSISVKRLIRQFPDKVLIPLITHYVKFTPSFLAVYSRILQENEKKTDEEESPVRNVQEQAWNSFTGYLKEKAELCKVEKKERFWSLITSMILSANAIDLKSGMAELSAFFPGIKETENTAGASPYNCDEDNENLPDISFPHSSMDPGEHVLISDQKTNNQPDTPEEMVFAEAESEKEVFVNNAGLILLHPFLKPFFLDCGLIGPDNVFTDKELAAHLLHYTATGKEMETENVMLLEKFLCNIQPHEPISREIPLPDRLKEKSLELLASVTEQWKALKNTSAGTIRNEFIQRPGKLVVGKDNPRIIVERKTQDILLEKLPWNISIVKIPWIEKLIFVEW
ncbi:contractile injection system tape measure protein [Sinomicrobium sp. M5D2P17]